MPPAGSIPAGWLRSPATTTPRAPNSSPPRCASPPGHHSLPSSPILLPHLHPVTIFSLSCKPWILLPFRVSPPPPYLKDFTPCATAPTWFLFVLFLLCSTVFLFLFCCCLV